MKSLERRVRWGGVCIFSFVFSGSRKGMERREKCFVSEHTYVYTCDPVVCEGGTCAI